MEEPNKYDKMAAEVRAMIERTHIAPPYSGNGFNFEAWSEAVTDFASFINLNVQHRPRGLDGKPSAALIEAVAAMQASLADFMRAFPESIPAITASARDGMAEEP